MTMQEGKIPTWSHCGHFETVSCKICTRHFWLMSFVQKTHWNVSFSSWVVGVLFETSHSKGVCNVGENATTFALPACHKKVQKSTGVSMAHSHCMRPTEQSKQMLHATVTAKALACNIDGCHHFRVLSS